MGGHGGGRVLRGPRGPGGPREGLRGGRRRVGRGRGRGGGRGVLSVLFVGRALSGRRSLPPCSTAPSASRRAVGLRDLLARGVGLALLVFAWVGEVSVRA